MPNILVLLAEGCEELEAVTIIDLLRRAELEVTVAGLTPGPVRASRGVVIQPDTDLDTALAHTSFDMVVLPGGLPGADNLGNDPRVPQLVQKTVQEGRYVAAICAAPRVLAQNGLLDGKKATGYPGFIDGGVFPALEYTGAPVEIDGKIITGRGPGTAMDFALTLIQALTDEKTRNTVEDGLVRT